MPAATASAEETSADETSALVDALRARGVIIPRPAAVVLSDLDPDAFEAGVEIHPGSTVTGRRSRYGAGTRIGHDVGGSFRNVCAGRGVSLAGGTFDDCVFYDGVTLRGHAEVRGGSLLEEGAEGAHHVGLKMTIMLPFVVAGSLINLCDALFAGGTSRKDHSEIGSCLALYNFTPWGDKFASWFGDVPRGVFVRSPRIFLGGQTQVVSPVHVGYGAVIPAGLGVRRSVPEGRMYGERMEAVDTEFDPVAYGGLLPKFRLTAEYVGNLRALEVWYRRVRYPAAADPFTRALYEAGARQVEKGIAERIKRLGKIVDRLDASRARHEELARGASDAGAAVHRKRIAEHERLAAAWPALSETLSMPHGADPAVDAPLERVAEQMAGDTAWTDRLAALDDTTVAAGIDALQRVVDAYTRPLGD